MGCCCSTNDDDDDDEHIGGPLSSGAIAKQTFYDPVLLRRPLQIAVLCSLSLLDSIVLCCSSRFVLIIFSLLRFPLWRHLVQILQAPLQLHRLRRPLLQRRSALAKQFLVGFTRSRLESQFSQRKH